MTDANDLIMGGGGPPTCKFPTIGTVHKGKIVHTDASQQKDPVNGDLKFWKDGSPMMQAILTLQTDERDPEVDDDDGQRRLFVAGKSMRDAIRQAVQAAGARSIEIGGTLAVQYYDDGEKSNPAFNAPKLYKAQYVAPVGGGADLLAAPAAPAPAVTADSLI